MGRSGSPSSGSNGAVQRKIRLRLYVAGNAPNSTAALHNLKAILPADDHAHRLVELEVVDVLEQPGRALADGVLVSPTLLRLSPAPVVRIVGNLSDRETVRAALKLGE